jgi:hypothetical protein
MAWAPVFNAGFTKPLIRQMLAIMNRDIGSALSYFFPVQVALTAPAAYIPFVEYDLQTAPLVNDPALLLMPSSMDFVEESQDTLEEEIRLYCAVAVSHQEPNAVAEKLEDYILAVRSVWESSFELTNADFYSTEIPLPQPLFPAGAMSPGLEPGSLKELHISGHAFDSLRRNREGLFASSATMLIRVLMEES